MRSILDRTIAALHRRLVILAPPDAAIPTPMRRTLDDEPGYQAFMRGVQRLRGRVYLADGALTRAQLTGDGRHQSPEDDRAWHLMTLGEDGQPNGCLWYRGLEAATGLDDLRVRRCPLAVDAHWRDRLHHAVKQDISLARRQRLQYAEIGGWAVTEDCRRSPDGIVLALSVFALGRLLGGSLGITTATVRHASSTILRRLGGRALEFDGTPIPSYFDPSYRCEMELLRFDSRHPGSRFAGAIERLEAQLRLVTVLAAPSLVSVAAGRSSFDAGMLPAAAPAA